MLEIRKLEEAAKPRTKKAFLLSGAFNPYTIGHEEAARQAAHYARKTGHTHLYHGLGSSANVEDAPLSARHKRHIVRTSQKHIKKDVKGIKMGVLATEHDTPFKQVLHLAKTGHSHVTLGLGSDQMKKNALRGALEKHVAKHGGMIDKEGKVHPVKLAFKKMGKTRDERPLHRTELLGRLKKGDLTVAKAGHLRKAVRSGDTELAHALMPKSVNKQKYHSMISNAQKKLTKKVHEGFVSFGEYIAETTTKKQKARARWQKIDHILRAQHHIAKNLGKGIDLEDQEPQARISHKSLEMARDSINRKLRKAVTEDIELIPVHRDTHPEKPRKATDVHKDYGSKTYSSDRVVKRKNLGEIHRGYDLHQHSVVMKDHRGKDVLKHKFTIVHRASGDIAGEMHAKGGKLHPTKGVVHGTKGKALRVTHLEMHPNHSSKKVGTSLPVEMYRHLHRRGHAIQSDTIQSHGAAHVWNTMRHDRELKKHMMIHSNREPLRGELHTFEKRAHRRPERHIWYQHSRNWSAGREKVEGSHGDEPDEVKTLVLSGKKRRKKVTEDIEIANVLNKPHGGYHRDFAKMVEGRGMKPKRSGRIAKGYTLYTSKDKDDPKTETHHIVHDATNHVAGEVWTRSHGDDHHVISTDIHGDHTKKKIGKSLAVLAYKHLARKKGSLTSSALQSPGGASIWNRLRKDPKMKGRVFHSSTSGEIPAHDLSDKKIWASEITKIERSKGTPHYLPPSSRHADEHSRVMGSRLVIRHPKKA